MSILVIAEKPSVATIYAKVLGVKNKKDGYFEGNGYIVSWCVGHLVGLAEADFYDERYSSWNREHLPIIPQNWLFKVAKDKKKQFDILKKLMNDSEVTEVVNGCDAGREGELIFRLVYEQAKCKKTIKRLWVSSMEDVAIKKGFDNLLNGNNYDNLYGAALCRAKADWIVGINATRLFTSLYGKTLNVGRVMTPTLAMICEREKQIKEFKSETFYTLNLEVNGLTASGRKFDNKPDGEKVRLSLIGKNAVVTKVKEEEKSENPPKLYDLTTLQRECNRLYGYTANETLTAVQSLYEKKLCTYPRTDSRYLTSDMEDKIPDLVTKVSGIFEFLSGVEIVNTKPIIDNGKVSDHHAIIPTTAITSEKIADLPTLEKSVLNLVATRLVTATGEKHKFSVTEVTLICENEEFKTKGKTVLDLGFKKFENTFFATLKNKEKSENEPTLPLTAEGEFFDNATFTLKDGKTSPPKRFSEDTLLKSMDQRDAGPISDFVGEEIDKEFYGLGTPATRAGIIEKLVAVNFIERKNKSLIPTETGLKLCSVLPTSIKSPKLTAEWEKSLKDVELGKLSADEFMSSITDSVEELVKSYYGVKVGMNAFDSDKKSLGKCPRCARKIIEIKLKDGHKGFVCESGTRDKGGCGFAVFENDIFFTSKHKTVTKDIIKAILKDKKIYMKDLFSEKKGILYNATVHLDDDGGKYVRFKLEFDNKKK